MQPLHADELFQTIASPLSFAGDEAAPFETASRLEWLSTNAVGGFASGTVAGSHARRYHALLVADLPAPHHRMALLGKVDETVTVMEERFDLSTNRYPNSVVHPQGWKYIAEFTPFPVPQWTYKMPGQAVLVKRVFLARGKNTVYVTYTLREAPSQVTVTLTPLVQWKGFHEQMHPWHGFPLRRGPEVGGWSVQATPDAPVLRMLVKSGRWTPAGWWHEQILHDRERERGLEYSEDLFCPAVCQVSLRVGQTVAFVATVEPDEPDEWTFALAEIVRHQERLIAQAGDGKPANATWDDLVRASDVFVIKAQKARSTIIAGYPWFGDWGRDTMIALPGLCFATKRFDEARAILSDFAGVVKDGLIPNRFPDTHRPGVGGDAPDYNTADATLWFVHACGLYVEATGDTGFQQMMLPILETILEAHERGTHYGIGMDADDGLLRAGEAGTQLTWMDAKVGDWVVTPRVGKPVEICALWINALRIVASWKGENGKREDSLAERASISFRAKFVRHDGQGLFDLITPNGHPDYSVRPNQVIAAALPHSPLTPEETRTVLEVATHQLLTPFGLKSLSHHDPAYKAHYFGSPRQRDGAYHQGTVWAWLIGPFVDVYRKVHGAEADVSALLAPLESHLRVFGVGGIAEVFDGDSPHTPNGCPWQAWSVAELLRVGR
jgi:predicted glycogen debranching enzyme